MSPTLLLIASILTVASDPEEAKGTPLTVTTSLSVYPDPWLFITRLDITPLELTVTSAVAPLPVPPTKSTLNHDVDIT